MPQHLRIPLDMEPNPFTFVEEFGPNRAAVYFHGLCIGWVDLTVMELHPVSIERTNEMIADAIERGNHEH